MRRQFLGLPARRLASRSSALGRSWTTPRPNGHAGCVSRRAASSSSSSNSGTRGRGGGGSSHPGTAALLAAGGLVALALLARAPPVLRLEAPTADAQNEQRAGQAAWVRGATDTRVREKEAAPGTLGKRAERASNPLDEAREAREAEDDKDKDKDNGSTIGVIAAAPAAWFQDTVNFDWSTVPDKVADVLLPEWTRMVPGFMRKLQRELDMAPGSLADEIWREARDPHVNPEVQYAARVRVVPQAAAAAAAEGDDAELCPEERAFRASRRRVIAADALARYLELPAEALPVHPDDVPVVALCGSGGGLRALVAGTGSLGAAADDGLFDCVTYTAGVSGSCWLQALYFATFTQQRFDRVAAHLRARLGVHIASPPDAFALLTAAPTNKFLLRGIVEKLRSDPDAGPGQFGLVDVYGTLLAARLLVPKGELGVSPLDWKISHQRRHLTRGQNPMPIYTAVRHEIPALDAVPASDDDTVSPAATAHPGPDKARDHQPTGQTAAQQQKEAWFQWFEITPYEFFCEEFGSGIPTWALGRRFHAGRDVPQQEAAGGAAVHQPEVQLPLLLGIFGSAFCATLSHYYKEIRPLVQRLGGLSALDELIWGRNEDLSKVHPIDPAELPNPWFGMAPAQLPPAAVVPPGVLARPRIQLMDAGMSNNLPLYPFLRPARGVEVVVVFDASADIRHDNWLCVADGYARRRGVRGWPVGVGWPSPDTAPAQAAQQLAAAGADATASPAAAEARLTEAKIEQAVGQIEAGRTTATEKQTPTTEAENARATARELGYCTVWVGSTEETVAAAAAAGDSPARADVDMGVLPPLAPEAQWARLTAPDAGLTLVYLPYLANPARVPGVDPATSEFMSTWNFVYTPEQVDAAVALARANYAEGAAQIRATVRAVYERKKAQRLAREAAAREARRRRYVRLGQSHRISEE